jgi:nucleotide-binding universal stress UspA family protein
MSLLCGIDFSEQSLRAAEAAARIAARTQRPLHLLHALDSGTTAEERDLRSAELAFAERGLRQVAERAAEHGAKVEVHLEDGSPDEVLLDLAGRVSAELIVVAALGRRRKGAFLVGGHAERLAQRAHVPVLVVRDPAPFESWAAGTRPLRILLGADASLSSDHAMQWINQLRGFGPCVVTALHLYWPPSQFQRLGLHGVRSYIVPDPAVTRALEHDFNARLAVSGAPAPRLRLEPHMGNVGQRIATLADEGGADLIVVGSHARTAAQRIAEGSVSRDLLHHARVSVACIPLPTSAQPAPAPQLRDVLVATDLSATGDAAVPLAYALTPAGGTVHIVHVIPERAQPPLTPHDIFAPESAANAKLRERLSQLIPQAGGSHAVSTQVHVLESNQVAQAICQAAERLDAGMICVGTHGASGLSGALLGSVAQAVVKHAARPVLLARKAVE